MTALIDLWLMSARLWLDLVAPLKLAPVTTVDFVPLAKARYIRGRGAATRPWGDKLTAPVLSLGGRSRFLHLHQGGDLDL